MKTPCVHLICNAHLDPVWQWRWEEGCAEALATFKTAAVLLEEHPRLIFNHNEAVLYQWVERYDPALFDAIRDLVRRERWCISGGWYLQPDANLPGLEAFYRHIMEGRRYFRDRFAVRPRVAYNFDSFGHHGGLPRILRDFGYEMYIHMRPQADELELPGDLYLWEGVDGTRIPCLRISVGLYHTERDHIEDRLREGADFALRLGRDVPVFWGLGDHGGGATREDLKKIDGFTDGFKERRVKFVHSTPELLFQALQPDLREAPVFKGDLQRVFTGCYTSLSRIKRRACRSLGRLVQAEALCAAAWWRFGTAYPEGDLDRAWRDHLFNDFHDILPGTCIETAEQDALDRYGGVAETVRALRLGAAAAFNRNTASGAALPVTVLNTNPALTRVPVEVEYMADYRPPLDGDMVTRLVTPDGSDLPCQEEKPEALLPFNDWRRKMCFMADLPPLGAAHYRVEHGRGDGPAPAGNAVDCDLDPGTGLMTGIRTPEGVPCLKGPLFAPLVVEDPGDAWGTGLWSYRNVAGTFEAVPGSVKVIEQGPVRTITESLHTFGHSRLVLHLITYAEWPVIESRFYLQWNETGMRLKMRIPTAFKDGTLRCEIPGGILVRPGDGEEHVHGRWLMVSEGKGRAALGIVNSGQHGLDFSAGEVRLSVLRSAAYCHEQGLSLQGRARRYMDQGTHTFSLLAVADRSENLLERLPGLTDFLAAPPLAYAHLPAGPHRWTSIEKGAGGMDLPAFLAQLPGRITLTACKRSRDGKALILRLHETTGLGEKSLGKARSFADLIFKPYETKSLRLERGGAFREVDPDMEC